MKKDFWRLQLRFQNYKHNKFDKKYSIITTLSFDIQKPIAKSPGLNFLFIPGKRRGHTHLNLGEDLLVT